MWSNKTNTVRDKLWHENIFHHERELIQLNRNVNLQIDGVQYDVGEYLFFLGS